jgi:N-acetylmuramoyl-L-alanine amidase
MAGNVLEKDLTFDIAERVDRLLGSQGIPTLLTRTGDSYVSLTDRAKLINCANRAIVVSIHFNDGPRPEVSGIETYLQPNKAPAFRRSQVGCLFCKRSVMSGRM